MNEKETNRTPTQSNQKLFQNYFTDYIVNYLTDVENFKNTINSLLSDFFEKIQQPGISDKFLGKKKNITSDDRLILSAFIRSYFFPISFELALSYAEQLGLLAITPNGVKRFSEHIAQCCIRIFKNKNTDFAESLCKLSSCTLDKISLKSLFILAGVNQKLFLSSNKSLLLYSGREITITKFFEHIGVRAQSSLSGLAYSKKRYNYFYLHKKSADYGYRNAVYIAQKTHNGIMQLQNEAIENKFNSENYKSSTEQVSYSYVVTLLDIKEYLNACINANNSMHDISQNGFNHYISELYFFGKAKVIAICLCLDLSQINFGQSNFNGVYFSGCDFTLSDLTNTSFVKSIFFENMLDKTIIDNTFFDQAILDFIDLSLAAIRGRVSFKNTKLCFGNLEGIVFKEGTDFEGANITGANCVETDFSAANTNNITHGWCITSEVLTYPDKHIKLKIFDQNDTKNDSKQNIPFQSYLISDNTQAKDIGNLLNMLFNNEKISNTNNFQLMNYRSIKKLAYGLYAANQIEFILENLRKVSLTLTKTNRQRACEYLIELLKDLHTHQLESKKILLEKYSDENFITIGLNVFVKEIKEKNRIQIEEYASILAQDVFCYNKIYFTMLIFSELEQGAIIQISKKNAPNFVAMQKFSDRLSYKICQDILFSDDPEVRSKIYQLYLLTAFKLLEGFRSVNNDKIKLNDLQGTSSIVMAFCHYRLSNLTSLGIILDHNDSQQLSTLLKNTFNPSGNFKQLRILTTEFSIPYLGQLSKDSFFAKEACSSLSLLEKINILGKMQKKISIQQMRLREFKVDEIKSKKKTDLIFLLENIHPDEVNIFFRNTENTNIQKSENRRIFISERSKSSISFYTSSDESCYSRDPSSSPDANIINTQNSEKTRHRSNSLSSNSFFQKPSSHSSNPIKFFSSEIIEHKSEPIENNKYDEPGRSKKLSRSKTVSRRKNSSHLPIEIKPGLEPEKKNNQEENSENKNNF